jgi:polysaccharide biosynthesis PFTS motif protein
MINNPVRRYKLRRLRRILRGHRRMKQSDCLKTINVVNEALTTSECIKDGVFSRNSFGAAVGNEELAIRQYLLVRFASDKLPKALLYAHGKVGEAAKAVVCPLPAECRKIVEKHGFKVGRIRSALAWYGYMSLFFAYGVFSIGKIAFQGIKEIISPSHPALRNFVYLEHLIANNLPQLNKDRVSHDIVSWYSQWPGRVGELDMICHSVKGDTQSAVGGIPLISVPSAIPPLTHFSVLLRYVGWGCAAVTRAALDLTRGRWWHALMLYESSRAAAFRLNQNVSCARDYLFNNSGWAYRPLWTYEAQSKGARVILYFYSANIEGFKRADRKADRAYLGYKSMNWPYYLVWDEDQADFIHRVVGLNANVTAVGPIWFNTADSKLPTLPLKSVAVFDVQPMRDAFYNTLAVDFDYYTPKTANQFLADVYETVTASNCTLTLKRKREIGNLIHPSYRSCIAELGERHNFVLVDSAVDPWQLIENSLAVISMPFTTTAIIAKEMGKHSVYYDPFGLLQKDDPAAHGVAILCGIEELEAWLSRVLEKESVSEVKLD